MITICALPKARPGSAFHSLAEPAGTDTELTCEIDQPFSSRTALPAFDGGA